MIWTDAIQSIILTLGAIFVVVLILTGMPEGAGQALTLASEAEKFSLGDMGLSFASSTVWVMLLYGIFINLTNFGIDQNFVQRYHAADSEKAARRSVWMGALLYMPVALMFFFIGSILFSYYQEHPALLEDVRLAKATELIAEQSPGLAKGSCPVTSSSVSAFTSGTLSVPPVESPGINTIFIVSPEASTSAV